MNRRCILLMSLVVVFMCSMAHAQATNEDPLSKASLILKQSRPLVISDLAVVPLKPAVLSKEDSPEKPKPVVQYRMYFVEKGGRRFEHEWLDRNQALKKLEAWFPTEERMRFSGATEAGVEDSNGNVITEIGGKSDPIEGTWEADCGSFDFSAGRFTHVCSGTPLEGGYKLKKGRIELSFDNGTSIIGTLKDGRVDGTMNNPKRGTSKAFTFTKR